MSRYKNKCSTQTLAKPSPQKDHQSHPSKKNKYVQLLTLAKTNITPSSGICNMSLT